MLLDFVKWHQRSQFFIAYQADLIDLVTSAKSIHKMKERNAAIQSGHLGHDCHAE